MIAKFYLLGKKENIPYMIYFANWAVIRYYIDMKADELTGEYKDLKDEEVVVMVQNGNANMFGEVMKRYEVKMRRYATRFFREKEEITDLVQDVFIKVYTNIQSFDQSQRFSPWIYRIAHNEFVNKIAWKSIRHYVPIDTEDFIPQFAATENVMREAIKTDEKSIMEKYLGELDYKYKTPIIMFYYEDLSYDEISEIMQIPPNTVGVRIKRGKDRLKEIIEKKGRSLGSHHTDE
jgi:RNA polymerase sigma-70 factor (ECF subfamily)